MANKEMKTIKFGQDSADTYVITDDVARAGLNTKQDTLVSGINIKTINNQSLLGSGDITIEGGGGSSGPSSMLVIEPAPIVYENLTWNQVLEKAFDVNSFYGLLFNSPTPSVMLIDNTSSFTLSNNDISIMVSADTVTVTVGAVSRNIYENGLWDSESDVVIKDEGVSVGVRYINDEGGGTISLDFVYADTGDSTTAILDTTGASSIKNISPDYVFFKTSTSGDTSSIKYFINNANITCTNVIFDSTFENNLVNDTYVMIGTSYDSSLVLQSGSGECIVGGTPSSFYSSDWQPTSTNLGNGCSWDVSTYTLTFPTPLKLWVESSLLSDVSNNIIFKIKTSGGEIILPDASNYSNQLAEIKDTINNVDLIIYSTGTEWKFASDVLQLSPKQFDSIPTEGNSLYGISVENRWCLDPNNGLPIKIYTGSNNWSMNYYQGQFSQNTVYSDSTTHISPFMSVNYNVTSSNSVITFNVEPSIYLSTILINVSDTIPTVTFADAWSTGATFIFKQDGTVVSSLTFAQNTYYKLTLDGANFNEQHVIFVDCQSYTKSV